MQSLKREKPDLELACEAADGIVAAGMRACDIIDHLRSLHKKSPPKRELVDLNEIVQEMVAMLQGEANRYAVSVRTDLAANLPRITADRLQLQQVLMNLMLNGIEAMKETGGALTGQVATGSGRPTADLSQRHRGRVACRKDGSDIQCLLYDQTVGLQHGTSDQPFHYRVAWRPCVGHGERRTGRLPFISLCPPQPKK
ncbi:sensor histidine kinase [Edaphobacter aggregans]|uniref:sensor histidine kinase n=1 Tax=Edaphobacter aggregans TaxID=570835 RepID=UPI0005550603|nr:ATP-binding protein [Edaphobacter aggregans]